MWIQDFPYGKGCCPLGAGDNQMFPRKAVKLKNFWSVDDA